MTKRRGKDRLSLISELSKAFTWKRIMPLTVCLLILWGMSISEAAPLIPIPNVNIVVEPASKPQDVALSLQILLILTILSLAPSIIIMMTAFTRIIVVLSFLRSALATQQMPPNQVLALAR